MISNSVMEGFLEIYLPVIMALLFLTLGIVLLIRTILRGLGKNWSADIKGSAFSVDSSRYAQTLSSMIQHKTISTKTDDYAEEMAKLQHYLKERFPLISTTCRWKNIDGGLLIKWSGDDRTRPLILMSHMDVVEAKGEWRTPPFSGEIKDKVVWGRGAVDTKGSLCAIFEAVESLIEEDHRPECDVYIFTSSREEIGGDDALKASEYLREKGIRPRLVIDEGGGMLDNPMAGVKGRFAMIAMSERSSAKLVIKAGKKGSLSAMERLSIFVMRVKGEKLSKRDFAPEVGMMFKELTPYMTFGMRLIFSNLWFFKPLILNLLPKMSTEAAAMIGATVSFSNLSGKEADRLPAGVCGLSATVASTFYHDIEECIERFIKLADKEGLDAELVEVRKTVRPEPVNSNGYKYVADTVRNTFRDVIPSPFIIFGGTDARHFVDISESVIRFAPLHFTSDQFASVHGENEHIHIESLCGGVLFYRDAICNIRNLDI